MVDTAVIETAQKYLAEIPDYMVIRKAFLFGSYAKGLQHKDSDIDIAVVFENMNDFFDTQMLLMRLRRNIDLRIEPHPIEAGDFNIQNPLVSEITQYGIELKFNKNRNIC